MPHIHVLPDDLVNQIAAGEVVERPASIVKELVENALDAEATRVSVTIAEGGIRMISVTDDGVGMAREDAERAFERHATSKVRSAEDLASVGTLGFRGEALPSIASVARVRVRTRRAEDAIGTDLEGEGSGISRISDIACPEGTTIEVAELFARVPARLKFLKSATTESTQIVRWLERIALVRTDVRFELIRDGKQLLFLPPTADPKERIVAVLPARATERLLPVEGELPTMRVTGYASPTDVMRGTTADIHVFVNGRPVRDRLLLHSVREGYRDALPPGRHPVAVLFLQVDPGEVDVNVHPAKWEVRFRDPASAGRLVRGSLRNAIGAGGHRATDPAYAPSPAAPPMSRPGSFSQRPATGEGGADFPLARDFFRDDERGAGEGFVADAPTPVGAPFRFAELNYVGQVMSTYLLFERSVASGGTDGQLVLIDQHAAHERVLFERLRQALTQGELERQQLLVPIHVELATSAADALESAAARLDGAGFELERGDRTLTGAQRMTVRAVPAILASRQGIDYAVLLEETAAMLLDPAGQELRVGLEAALHGILATAACHSATRAGDRLEPEEVSALLAALDDTIWFPNCPHGRPFVSVLDEADLERRFLRR